MMHQLKGCALDVRIVAWLAGFVMLGAGVAGCASSPKEDGEVEVSVESIQGESSMDGAMTVEQLESELLGLAGFQIDRLIVATDEMMLLATTADQRVMLSRARVRGARSILDVATQPNAATAMLDMVVLLTLQRMAIEQAGEAVFGVPVDPYIEATRAGERDAWSLAERVLSPEQQAGLRLRIDQWRAANPDSFVGEVRLSDFARSRQQVSIDQGGGLLLPQLDETTRAIDEARMLGERALTRLKYMPVFARWEAMVLVEEILARDDIQAMLRLSDRFDRSVNELSTSVRQLSQGVIKDRTEEIDLIAAAVAAERQAAIEQVMGHVAEERLAWIDAIEAHEGPLQSTLAELRATLESGDEFVDSLNVSIEALNTLSNDIGASQDGAEPLEAEQFSQLARELGLAAQEATTLVESLNELLSSPAWGERGQQLTGMAGQVEQESEKIVAKLFWAGVLLIVILLVGLLLTRLAQEYLTRRLFREPRPTAGHHQ